MRVRSGLPRHWRRNPGVQLWESHTPSFFLSLIPYPKKLFTPSTAVFLSLYLFPDADIGSDLNVTAETPISCTGFRGKLTSYRTTRLYVRVWSHEANSTRCSLHWKSFAHGMHSRRCHLLVFCFHRFFLLFFFHLSNLRSPAGGWWGGCTLIVLPTAASVLKASTKIREASFSFALPFALRRRELRTISVANREVNHEHAAKFLHYLFFPMYLDSAWKIIYIYI